MMIQRTNSIKFLRYLGIFCALTMGFFSIVATSEDDVEDAAAFDEELQIASVTVTDGDPAPASLHEDCESGLSINGLADDASVDTDDPQVYGTGAWNETNEEFGILVLEDADGSCTVSSPVINRGDKVMLCVSCTSCFSGLDPRDDVWGMVIPEEGAPGLFAFRVPASLTDTVYDLY